MPYNKVGLHETSLQASRDQYILLSSMTIFHCEKKWLNFGAQIFSWEKGDVTQWILDRWNVLMCFLWAWKKGRKKSIFIDYYLVLNMTPGPLENHSGSNSSWQCWDALFNDAIFLASKKLSNFLKVTKLLKGRQVKLWGSCLHRL